MNLRTISHEHARAGADSLRRCRRLDLTSVTSISRRYPSGSSPLTPSAKRAWMSKRGPLVDDLGAVLHRLGDGDGLQLVTRRVGRRRVDFGAGRAAGDERCSRATAARCTRARCAGEGGRRIGRMILVPPRPPRSMNSSAPRACRHAHACNCYKLNSPVPNRPPAHPPWQRGFTVATRTTEETKR